MAFVDEQQAVVGQVIEQRRRRLTRLASGQKARVILDTAAITQFTHHFDIVVDALLEPLRLDQLVVAIQFLQALLQFLLDIRNHAENDFARRRVVSFRVDRHALDAAADLAGERVEITQAFHLGIEQLDAHRLALRIRRVHVDDLAAHAVSAALQLEIVSLVLQLGEPAQDAALIDFVAHHQVQQHLQIGIGITETINRRH